MSVALYLLVLPPVQYRMVVPAGMPVALYLLELPPVKYRMVVPAGMPVAVCLLVLPSCTGQVIRELPDKERHSDHTG
jgi:hypothetical protein